jgi:hypothetical protein
MHSLCRVPCVHACMQPHNCASCVCWQRLPGCVPACLPARLRVCFQSVISSDSVCEGCCVSEGALLGQARVCAPACGHAVLSPFACLQGKPEPAVVAAAMQS